MHLLILLQGLQSRLQGSQVLRSSQKASSTQNLGDDGEIECLVEHLRSLILACEKDDDITLIFNGRMEAEADVLWDKFRDLLPKIALKFWTFPGPFTSMKHLSSGQKFASNALRDRLVEALQPDAVLHVLPLDCDPEGPILELQTKVLQFALVSCSEENHALAVVTGDSAPWNGILPSGNASSDLLLIRRQLQKEPSRQPCRPSPLSDDEQTQAFLEELHRHLPGMNAPLANAVDQTFEGLATPEVRQLFVDVTELSQMDAGTGIQRVTRNILSELVKAPPAGFAIRPVFSEVGKGFRYAHQFAQQRFGLDDGEGGDVGLSVTLGDVFLGLDFTVLTTPSQQSFLKSMQRRGAQIWFVVYDLIPLQFPQWVRSGNDEFFAQWLWTIAQFDGLMCISQSVAKDVSKWLDARPNPNGHRPQIRWFHLGSDLDQPPEEAVLSAEAQTTLAKVQARPTFLMVSTVEPRKGYAQALAAFEELWTTGIDVNLVIVGREGWLVESLVQKLRHHPENERRLFWLQGIGDDFLKALYGAATAVLMTSEAEGFGLAVVEGARHHKPLILRDLPVFREIAQDAAFYFSGNDPKDIASRVRTWLELNDQGLAPSSEGVEVLTWEESARQLVQNLLK